MLGLENTCMLMFIFFGTGPRYLLYDCHVTLSHFVEKNVGLKHTFKTVYVTADVAELS